MEGFEWTRVKSRNYPPLCRFQAGDFVSSRWMASSITQCRRNSPGISPELLRVPGIACHVNCTRNSRISITHNAAVRTRKCKLSLRA